MHCHYQFHGGLCFPCGYTYYKITDWLTFSVHFATTRVWINYIFAKYNIITSYEGFPIFFIRTLTDWNESKACWWCIDCICLAYWYIFIIELWWYRIRKPHIIFWCILPTVFNQDLHKTVVYQEIYLSYKYVLDCQLWAGCCFWVTCGK